MERFQSIKSNARDGYYVELLNSHYDDQLRQMIQRINKSVRLLQESSLSLPTPPSSTCLTSMNKLPKTSPVLSTPTTSGKYNHPISPVLLTSTTSGKYNQISPKPIDYQRLDVSTVTTRPILSKHAIRRMEAWYTEHLEHPYPSSSVVSELARVGGITMGQVKKWFANKRNRSKNTKSLTAIACRKRLEKLAQLLP
ncbi:uncharacterized protein LOC126817921 [Patella vulgata]|uniref:uncharacterized protein LOC126817921 n=1 Tax=Patella vulgata TaxID=6465 RepID=UPI00217F7890|nr:uncharacterized protein LOC126817921 [Patella vulgata]